MRPLRLTRPDKKVQKVEAKSKYQSTCKIVCNLCYALADITFDEFQKCKAEQSNFLCKECHM